MSKLLTLLVFALLLTVGAAIDDSQENAGKTMVLDLKSTPDGQLFYVQLQVGEAGKQQTFKMLVASAYHLTWIPSKNISPIRGYTDKRNSPRETRSFATNAVAGMFSSFLLHSDWVKIGSQLVENQQIAVMVDRGGAYFEGQEKILDGMLGLSVYDTIPEGSMYLFENLHHQSYIDKLMFSLYINNSVTAVNGVDLNQPSGALVLGGIDQRYFTGDINYIKLHDDPVGAGLTKLNKSLIITSIQIDWSKVGKDVKTTVDLPQSLRTGKIDLHSKPARLRLDSTTKLYVGDKRILDKIHLDLIGAKLVGHNGVYVFSDCLLDNKPDIVFSLVGMEIVMTPEDYVLNGEIDGKEHCFSALKGYQPRNMERKYPLWVFGTRFLRKYYTIFDFENDVVGFATPR